MIELGKGNVAVDKSFELALGIIDFTELLSKQGKKVVANQLLRSGTAVGALVAESQDAESKADFIHKMKIAAKEASETLYWLSVCEKMNNFGFQHALIDEVKQIVAIISKIIITARKNR